MKLAAWRARYSKGSAFSTKAGRAGAGHTLILQGMERSNAGILLADPGTREGLAIAELQNSLADPDSDLGKACVKLCEALSAWETNGRGEATQLKAAQKAFRAASLSAAQDAHATAGEQRSVSPDAVGSDDNLEDDAAVESGVAAGGADGVAERGPGGDAAAAKSGGDSRKRTHRVATESDDDELDELPAVGAAEGGAESCVATEQADSCATGAPSNESDEDKNPAVVPKPTAKRSRESVEGLIPLGKKHKRK